MADLTKAELERKVEERDKQLKAEEIKQEAARVAAQDPAVLLREMELKEAADLQIQINELAEDLYLVCGVSRSNCRKVLGALAKIDGVRVSLLAELKARNTAREALAAKIAEEQKKALAATAREKELAAASLARPIGATGSPAVAPVV